MKENKITLLNEIFEDSRTLHDKFKSLRNGYSYPHEVRVFQSPSSKRCFVTVRGKVINVGRKTDHNVYSLALMSDIPKEGYNDHPLFMIQNEFDDRFGYPYECLDLVARDEKDEEDIYHKYRYFGDEFNLDGQDLGKFRNRNDLGIFPGIISYEVKNLPRFIDLQSTFINLIDQIKSETFQLPKLIPK